MKTIKKVLIHKEYESPTFWQCELGDDRKAKSFFELKLYFDFKEGLRFTASAPNVSFCKRNPFKAILRLLEHESIGMTKYQMLKDRARKVGVSNRL